MKNWSDSLIEFSKVYLYIDGVRVKNLNGNCGILKINCNNQTFKIKLTLKSVDKSKLIFNNVDEMIKAGWVVD